MAYIDLDIDVSAEMADVFPGEDVSLSSWIFLPKRPTVIDDRVPVLVMLNGATYDKRYWHFTNPRTGSHSFAEHLSDSGAIVVLLDHLGVGASARPLDGHRINRHVAARAVDAACRQVFERLQSGTLTADLRPLPNLLKIGGGHSMGAMVIITQQASHGTFDGLLVTGYTAIGVHLLIDGQLVSGDMSPADVSNPPYVTVPHATVRDSFLWHDVGEDLIALDDAMTVDVPYMLIVQSSTAGIIAEDAARIDVPVFLCLGEIDVSPMPANEPGLFGRSPQASLHILPRSGHCQAFADTRYEMFDAIAGWLRRTQFAPLTLPA